MSTPNQVRTEDGRSVSCTSRSRDGVRYRIGFTYRGLDDTTVEELLAHIRANFEDVTSAQHDKGSRTLVVFIDTDHIDRNKVTGYVDGILGNIIRSVERHLKPQRAKVATTTRSGSRPTAYVNRTNEERGRRSRGNRRTRR